MFHKSKLKLHFCYRELDSRRLFGAKVNVEFSYDAPTKINLLEKLENKLEPNLISIIKAGRFHNGLTEDVTLTVLDALINLKEDCQASITASPLESFRIVLTKALAKKGCNTTEKINYYLNNISPVLSFSEREKIAETQKNFIEAFALAQDYKTLFLQNYLEKTRGWGRNKVVGKNIYATEWLAKGLEFIKEKKVELSHYMNLDDFLIPLDHIRRKILHCDANPTDKQALLNALINNKTIKAVIIEKQEDLNDFLYALLKSNTFIKRLIISIEVNEKLSPQFIEQLAEILKVNASLVSVEFNQGREIKTNDFQVILNALAMNPNSKLTHLSGQRVAINKDEKAELLINHLKQHNKLEFVEPWHYLVISKNNHMEINSLLASNKEKKHKIKHAFIKGSTQGFFTQLGMPKDLGVAMAPYITRHDAYNLIQVAKLPAQRAKELRDDMIEQVKYRR